MSKRKYYCDYCDAFLTNNTVKERNAHNKGKNHKAAVQRYYWQFQVANTQKLVDEIATRCDSMLSSGNAVLVPIGPHGYPGVFPPAGEPLPAGAVHRAPPPPVATTDGYIHDYQLRPYQPRQ
jgi:U1 zinc finger